MATSSISGLASGLDTASIINQLMQLEAFPQSRLASRVSTEKSKLSALQALNTNAALLAGKAEALAKPDAWTSFRATSSNAAVTATATASARPTSLTLDITSVARSHQLGFTGQHALTDRVTGASTTVVLDRLDGTTVSIDSGDGTLDGLVSAINDPANDTGLRAMAVRVGEGQYRLLVESSSTGAAQDFDLTAEDGSPLLGGATVRAGSDATVLLGAGISASSPDGTFTDLVPGLTVTLGSTAKVGDTTTVAVARDNGALTRAKELVDGLNALLSDLDTKSAAGSGTTAAGVLAGDAGVRSLRSALLSSVYPADGSSLASLGLQVTRQGKIELDTEKLAAAYAADPDAVAAAFSSTGNGFAARVQTVAKNASDAGSGTITAAIKGRQGSIDRLQKDVEAWDLRLELRRTTLTRQYTALETALGQMSNQSSWLAGQIASLPSYD